jgi:hypothetical protein
MTTKAQIIKNKEQAAQHQTTNFCRTKETNRV